MGIQCLLSCLCCLCCPCCHALPCGLRVFIYGVWCWTAIRHPAAARSSPKRMINGLSRAAAMHLLLCACASCRRPPGGGMRSQPLACLARPQPCPSNLWWGVESQSTDACFRSLPSALHT